MTAAVTQVSPIDSPAFRAWLGERLCVARPVLSEARTPTGGGWSSETHLFSVSAGDAGVTQRVVLRVAPQGPAMFPRYDLGRQVACLEALAGQPACPVPAVLGADLDGVVLGRPFYLMRFVAGDIPADDRPDLFEAGFLFEASAADQRRFFMALLRALAALRRLRVGPALRNALERPSTEPTALARELAWLAGVHAWGGGPEPQPAIDAALAKLKADLPDDSREGLSWGDARPANVVARGFKPAALLDWELATLGPPELDVVWLLEMNAMRSRGRNLPGFLEGEAAIAAYEALTGEPLRHSAWHTLHAATKVAVLMLRHLKVREALGALPGGHPILTENIATRRLARLLE